MARRIPISRRGSAAGRKITWLLRLDVRLAVLATILFGLFFTVVAPFMPRRDDGRANRLATAWAHLLMRDSSLTDYGWIPDEQTANDVDASLAAVGAAYVFVDPQRRVVRASMRLRIARAVLMLPTTDGIATIPPIGRVEVTRVPLAVFGVPQGHFLLLSSRTTSQLPMPSQSVARRTEAALPQAASMALTFPAFLVGSGLSGLGMLLFAYLLVTRRVIGMAAIAASKVDGTRAPRRFAGGTRDELGALAQALNANRRRAHLLLAAMTERENRRRDWLSELSHDIRTPLAALVLRLQNALDASGDAQRLETVAAAIHDCDRIQELAHGFMDLAQLEVTEDFEFEPVMPEELVGQAVEGLLPIADKAQISVTTSVPPQPTILGDGHRLLRALENLLRNAIRHARSTVLVGVEHGADHVRFYVRDDGEGFRDLEPGEAIEYADWQGRAQAGGLGLRVADRVARAHSGSLLIVNGSLGTEVSCVVDVPPPERSKKFG